MKTQKTASYFKISLQKDLWLGYDRRRDDALGREAYNIVTCRLISRQRPEYEHVTIENVLEEVFSVWSASSPVLGNGSIKTHSENGRCVSYVIRTMPSVRKRANK
jgi:hypothetical protein